jgi:hypothetical protein
MSRSSKSTAFAAKRRRWYSSYASPVLGGIDQLILGRGNLLVDAARDEALGIPLQLLEHLLHETNLVGLVVDREVRPVAEARRLAPQDPAAGGMEGQDPDAAGHVGQQLFQP